MRFDSQLSRMNCQTFSTGLSSGHFAGSGSRVMLAGMTRPAEMCQPAWSRISTAWAPGATAADISARWSVTCTPELAPFLGRVCFSTRRTNEEEQVFRRADHRDREAAGGFGMATAGVDVAGQIVRAIVTAMCR